VNIIFKNHYTLVKYINIESQKRSLVYSSKILKVLQKIKWIFVKLLSVFVIRNFIGICSSVDMLTGCMVRERLGIPEYKHLMPKHKKIVCV